MERVVQIVSTLPTVVFTAMLIVCLTWWLLSFVISGLEVDMSEADPSDSGGLEEFIRGLGFGSVPLALALTVFSFGAWAASLLLSLTWDARTSGAITAAMAIGTIVASAFVGSFIVRRFATLMAPVFDDTRAPGRADAHGASVRVRTTYVDERFGQAEVLDGPTRNNIVKVRAPAGRFQRGDVGMIVDFDEVTDSFALIELDAVLRGDA